MVASEFHAAPVDPRGPLRAAVGYRTVQDRPGEHRGLPSPSLTFIVTFDEPVRLADSADDRGLDLLLAGLHMEPTMVRMPTVQTGIQAAVHPLAARALFGLPASELRDLSLAGEEVLGRAAGRLRERLGEADGWDERFRALLAETAGWARGRAGGPGPRAEVVAAWQLLEASRGGCRVEELAARVNLNRRRLSTLFARELGVSPKQAARTMRFTHALARVRRGVREGDLDLAAVAAQCAYADQSHLVREFHEFVGTSPSAWIAEEFPNIQAGGHGYASEWEA